MRSIRPTTPIFLMGVDTKASWRAETIRRLKRAVRLVQRQRGASMRRIQAGTTAPTSGYSFSSGMDTRRGIAMGIVSNISFLRGK